MRRPSVGSLMQNAVALIISGGGSAVVGVVFWGVAAHVGSTAAVGRTTAEIAAMTLLASLAQLSFGSSFERFLPIAGERTRSFVTRAYATCVSLALIIAIAYVSMGLGERFISPSFVWRALFVVAVVLWTIFALQDSVLVGLRATRWVPVENILYGLVKLAILPTFIMLSAREGIFIAWMTPVVVMVILVNWYLFVKRIPEHESLNPPSESLPSMRELVVLTGAQYASLLIGVLSSSVVILIVIQRLGAVANAYYYMPAQISSGVGLFLVSIDRSFLVEASSEPQNLRHHARVTLRAGIVVLVPSVVIGVIFAPEMLRIFGATYATHGTTLLRMLLLALPGSAITWFYASFAWIDRRVLWMVVRELVSTAVYFILIFTLIGHFGILAIGIASLVSSGLQGIFFLPILIRRYRMTPDYHSPKNGEAMTDPDT
jgi:O-antigen/teichoic acid export membrane protein